MLDDFQFPVDNSDLPTAERAIAAIIGRSAAIRLSWRILHTHCQRTVLPTGSVDKRFGAFYVPKKYRKEFAEKVGDEAAARELVARLGGEQFQLTGCRQAIKRLHTHMIRKLYQHGASRPDIVRASALTDRQVRRLCAGIERGGANQSDEISRFLVELSALSGLLAADPL